MKKQSMVAAATETQQSVAAATKDVKKQPMVAAAEKQQSTVATAT